MDKLKKSVFGGYRKAEVEAKLWDLEKRAEKAEADLEKATEDCESLQKTAEELRHDLFAQEERNALLQDDLKKSKENSANDHIIGKVYRHAYEAGAEITGAARDGANEFLSRVDGIYEDNKTQIVAQTEALSAVGTEIAELIEQMNRQTEHLQKILSTFNQKVSSISVAYDGMNDVRNTTAKRINDAIAGYEESAQSFLELIDEKNSTPTETTPAFNVAEAQPVISEKPAPELKKEEPEEPVKPQAQPILVVQSNLAPKPSLEEIENNHPVPSAVVEARMLMERANAVFNTMNADEGGKKIIEFKP